MKRLLTLKLLVSLALFFTLQSELRAQELNETALKERFQRQMELFKAATLGPSRGLVLTNSGPAPEATPVPIATPETTPAKVGSTQASSNPGASANPAKEETVEASPTSGNGPAETSTTAAATITTPQTYWKLPDDDQVNYRVQFAFDSSAIAPKEKPMLQKLCSVVKEMDIKLIRIVGHTDASGGARYNQNLSTLRAREVARFFTEDCQIPRERLEAVGVGEQFPLDAQKPRADENRRVEFQAVS
ncbi:OmpA family protein [Rhizobium sp. K102]|jgi:outer membrane protein OmpA-like peptidoglycan-associated protein|uniref:OmpA family protein n=1 Tax=Rhizobium sp. K102 TaxID=2918527 RepID=UPI001EFB2EB1|nr:OmpA family protein [Rhizobium sp. K102]ULR46886.1 OmpA family protein [Rhizobium sp. K102]